MNSTIELNAEEFEEFKKKCNGTDKGEIFIFKGKEVLKEYGEYVIEYLEPRFTNAK